MKLSDYTFILRKGICSLIYNCRTDSLSVIDNHLADLVETGSIDVVEQSHPDFYDFLCKESFLVDNDVDECSSLIEEWKKEEKLPYISLFVNTTMDCNLRCWYCYEKHIKDSNMPDGVREAVVNLVCKKMEEDNIKAVNLSFFGGEPLLAFDDVVVPMLRSLNDMSAEKHVYVCVSFVTNGVLLTEKRLHVLKSIPICGNIAFQVTLDGNQEYHDMTKHFANGQGSYSTIVKNIKTALRLGEHITLRFNTTKDNLMSFADVMSDFENVPRKDLENLEIDFQHVWQDGVDSQIAYMKGIESLRNKYVSMGFKVRELKHIDNSRCYADRRNHYTINYNGDVYKCTARDFSTVNREGVLKNDGKVEWDEKHELREKIKYGNETCHKCNIFPICHGGCSQFKMETMSISSCLRGYSQEDKLQIIKDRADFIINNH